MSGVYDDWYNEQGEAVDVEQYDVVCPNPRCGGVNCDILSLPNPDGWWDRQGKAKCKDCGATFAIEAIDE